MTKEYVGIVLLVLLLISILNGIVQFQNKTIQLIIEQNVNVDGNLYCYVIACLFAVGNLITALGLSKRMTKVLSGRPSGRITLIFVALFCTSLIFMSSKSVLLIMIGYILVSMGKGLYRPFFQSMFSILQPVGNWKAKWFSISSMVSGIIIAVINSIILKYTDNLSNIQLIWCMMLFFVGGLTGLILYKVKEIRLELGHINGASLSKKYRVLDLEAGDKVYFEKAMDIKQESVVLRKNITDSCLNAPILLSIEKDKRLRWEFVDGVLLESVVHSLSEKIVGEVLADLKDRTAIDSEEDDKVDCIHGSANQTALNFCSCRCTSHNDLHPGNILINEIEDYKVIDWEFSGLNCRLFDEFSFLWHPYLAINLGDRIHMTKKLISKHPLSCHIHHYDLKDMVKRLLTSKINDVTMWRLEGTDASCLKEAYKELLSQLEDLE